MSVKPERLCLSPVDLREESCSVILTAWNPWSHFGSVPQALDVYNLTLGVLQSCKPGLQLVTPKPLVI